MIAAIISIGQAQGGGLWLAGWLSCAALYFVFLLFRKTNQTSANVKNIVFWFLAAECSSDLIWAVVSYGSPAYIQYGIAAVYGLLFVIHPVYPEQAKFRYSEEGTQKIARMAGLICIAIGLITEFGV